MSDSGMVMTEDKCDVGHDLSSNNESRIKRPLVHITLIFGSLVVIVLAILLRLLIIGREPVNSDEAVVGMMAHEILHGHFFAFYWGQNYGGVEPYIVAFVFLIFGQSAFTLGIAPVLLDFLAAFLLFRIGKRFFSFRVAFGASLLFLIWPEVYVWQSTIEYGFRFVALDIGLAMVLLVLNIIERVPVKNSPTVSRGSLDVLPIEGQDVSTSVPKRQFFNKNNFNYLLLGLLSGLGWWATPEIVYFAIPLALLIIYSLVRKRFKVSFSQLTLFMVGIGIGAMPWLYDNVGRGFPSLHANPQANPSMTEHFRVFATHVLPMILGLRLIASGNWLWSKNFGLILYALVLLICFAYLVISIKEKKNFFLIMFLLLFPFLYAYSPFTWYWQDGRYAIYLAPFLSLYLVAAVEAISVWLPSVPKRLGRSDTSSKNVEQLGSKAITGYALSKTAMKKVSTLAVSLLVTIGMTLTLADASNVSPFVPNQNIAGESGWLSFQTNSNNWLEPAVKVLGEHHIKNAFAGYWLAYSLAFASNGTLTVSPTLFVRYAPYYSAIKKASKVAWIFPNPSRFAVDEEEVGTSALYPGCIGGYRKVAVPGFGLLGCLSSGEMESYLNRIHDRYKLFYMGDLLAVVPNKSINPAVVYRAEHIY